MPVQLSLGRYARELYSSAALKGEALVEGGGAARSATAAVDAAASLPPDVIKEKNFMPWALGDDALYFTYSITPHRVIRCARPALLTLLFACMLLALSRTSCHCTHTHTHTHMHTG
jgi:hypothetical protein